ncbi:MAG: PAS domain S-box protein, partial [Sedimentisphaerales bacterium]
YVNPYMIEKFGADKWLDHTAIDYYPPEVAKGVLAHDDRVLAEGPSAGEEWVPDKDGDMRCMHTHKFPIQRQGRPPLIGGMAIDITERKEAEEALRKSEEKHKKLFEETTDAIFVADAETGILTDCNRVAAELVGRVKSELVGEHQRILHPPQEIEGKFSMTFKQHLRGKEGQVLEAKVITKKGEIKDVAIKASRFELRGRKLIQALFRDVTERRKAEEALRQSEEKHRSVIENISVGVSLISPKMEVLALNRQLSQWYPDVDVLKKPVCYEVFNNPPRKSICPYCPIYKSLKDGRVHEAVTETPAGDKTKNYRIISSPIKDKDGRVIAAIEMVEDITDLRQREQELALYREKMTRAEQLASVGTLSATLAHELTQPLTVIRLSIENLLEELKTASCPESVTEQLTDSLTGIVDAAAIVDRFRDFARKSSEKTLGKVELKAIVEKIVELLNESAKRAKLALLIRNMNELPPVHSNERNIAQLFFALIENAIQAADGKKQSRLTITGDLKNEHVRLSFSDNCGGIATKNLDRIFEPFFTTGSDGTRTGLGLCIVKKILSECGGDIQVDSRFGKGTTFYVTLPLRSKKSNEDF